MCLINEANFTAASLLVISEVFNTRADIKYEVYQTKAQEQEQKVISKQVVNDSEDEEEQFMDLDRVKEEKSKHKNVERNIEKALAEAKF